MTTPTKFIEETQAFRHSAVSRIDGTKTLEYIGNVLMVPKC